MTVDGLTVDNIDGCRCDVRLWKDEFNEDLKEKAQGNMYNIFSFRKNEGRS